MDSNNNDPLAHVPAWLAGSLGGIVASLAQFIGGPANECIAHLLWGDWKDAMKLLGVFLFATALLMVAGAIVGYFAQSKSQSRWAIFLAGAAATAIVTMALPGLKPLLNKLAESSISTAYAAEDLGCKSELNKVSFGEGLKAFFGLDEPRYRVVVGSFKKPDDGLLLANKIKAADPTLHAFVGQKMPCNEYYPVIVSDYVAAAEAKKVQERVLKLDFIPGAYLSPYAWR